MSGIIKKETKWMPDKLLGKEWYIDQLGLLLKKSKTLNQHIQIYIDILNLMYNKEIEFFDILGNKNDEGEWHLNISFDENENAYYVDEDNKIYIKDIIDTFASIFGVRRTYYINQKSISLTDREMYILMILKIIQNNFDGTNKFLEDKFNYIKLILKEGEFYYETRWDIEATCFVYIYGFGDESNIKILAENGYFNVKSMGITYNCYYVSPSQVMLWDYTWTVENNEAKKDLNSSRVKWNEARWG